jgi:hypothetical protein
MERLKNMITAKQEEKAVIDEKRSLYTTHTKGGISVGGSRLYEPLPLRNCSHLGNKTPPLSPVRILQSR